LYNITHEGSFWSVLVSRRRIWFFTILFFPLLAAADEPITLTMDEAVSRALDHSINLRKSAIDLNQAGYSANRLWSEIFPSFSLSAGFAFLPATPLFTDPGFSYRSDALSYSLSFGLSLSLNPSFYSSMRRIELAYRSQLLSYENASRQLEIHVIKNFLNLVTMKANVSLLKESLELATLKQESDRIAWANGHLSDLAWLNSQLSVKTAQFNLSSAQGVYQNTLGEFLALLGMEPASDIIFVGTIEIVPVRLDPEQLILEHLPKRPDIISQRQIIERLELNRNVTANSSRSPTLNLSGQWRGNPTPNAGGISAPLTDNLSGSLTLNIPIDSWIPGTRQNQAIRAAGTELEKALLDLQNTETQARNQIRSLVTRLNSTWESLEIARMRVQVAERIVEAATVGFRNGTVEFRELEDRRNDLSDARQRLFQGEFSYQSLLLDLAAALNVDWKSLVRDLQ
jgi:multidrug efflux system outer membrane protein